MIGRRRRPERTASSAIQRAPFRRPRRIWSMVSAAAAGRRVPVPSSGSQRAPSTARGRGTLHLLRRVHPVRGADLDDALARPRGALDRRAAPPARAAAKEPVHAPALPRRRAQRAVPRCPITIYVPGAEIPLLPGGVLFQLLGRDGARPPAASLRRAVRAATSDSRALLPRIAADLVEIAHRLRARHPVRAPPHHRSRLCRSSTTTTSLPCR